MNDKNIILKSLSNLQNAMNNASGGVFERLKNVEIKNGNLHQKNQKLEQALNDIEKYIEEHQEKRTYTDRGGFTCTDGHFLRDSDDLLEIIQKAKGDAKNENNRCTK